MLTTTIYRVRVWGRNVNFTRWFTSMEDAQAFINGIRGLSVDITPTTID